MKHEKLIVRRLGFEAKDVEGVVCAARTMRLASRISSPHPGGGGSCETSRWRAGFREQHEAAFCAVKHEKLMSLLFGKARISRLALTAQFEASDDVADL